MAKYSRLQATVMTDTSLMNNRLFPSYYREKYEALVVQLGPKIPMGMYSNSPGHPLYVIVPAMLSLAVCHSLAYGYSGGGYETGGGSEPSGPIMAELIGFVNGWYYCGVVNGAVIPDRYADVIEAFGKFGREAFLKNLEKKE